MKGCSRATVNICIPYHILIGRLRSVWELNKTWVLGNDIQWMFRRKRKNSKMRICVFCFCGKKSTYIGHRRKCTWDTHFYRACRNCVISKLDKTKNNNLMRSWLCFANLTSFTLSLSATPLHLLASPFVRDLSNGFDGPVPSDWFEVIVFCAVLETLDVSERIGGARESRCNSLFVRVIQHLDGNGCWDFANVT